MVNCFAIQDCKMQIFEISESFARPNVYIQKAFEMLREIRDGMHSASLSEYAANCICIHFFAFGKRSADKG